jgi:hypothetical protein
MRDNPVALREEVAERARRCCEYCQIPEDAAFAPHHLDHIVARKHGGKTSLDNLAYSCSLCNRRKSSDLSSVDPATGQIALLFNPRRDLWQEHFELRGGEIAGLTPSGRATVHLLRLNHTHRVQERRIRLGWVWTRGS